MNHELPFRNVFEMMVEDAIRSINGIEEDSSATSNSCMCNHLDCITELTHGENGSLGNSYLRMCQYKYTTELRLDESTFTFDDETIPSELSMKDGDQQ
jgi:hypothetical protein